MKATMKNMVKVDKGAMMYCPLCRGEYSANASDYFLLKPDHKFYCCGRLMELVTKHTVHEPIH